MQQFQNGVKIGFGKNIEKMLNMHQMVLILTILFFIKENLEKKKFVF